VDRVVVVARCGHVLQQVIARIEQAVLPGGLFAMAMPRGSGKSTISEW
jgi:ABC-type dipeptide/oligopeptide/nickel transport system ATPase subunit